MSVCAVLEMYVRMFGWRLKNNKQQWTHTAAVVLALLVLNVLQNCATRKMETDGDGMSELARLAEAKQSEQIKLFSKEVRFKPSPHAKHS